MVDVDAFAWLEGIVSGGAGNPWVYAVVFAACLLDGFFPPVPSEAVLAGLGAVAITQGTPEPVLLVVAAAAGAWVGDNVAYSLGRRLGGRLTRTNVAVPAAPGTGTGVEKPPREVPAAGEGAATRWCLRCVRAALARVGSGLERHGAQVVLSARFIPVGRVGVNLAAGASRFPRRRFVAVAATAAALWAVYTAAVGAAVGLWLPGGTLVQLVVAILVAGALGLAADRIAAGRRRRAACLTEQSA